MCFKMKNISNEQKFLDELHKKDARAFRQLFMAFYKPLVYFAMQYTHDRGQSEDIVSEFFVTIWEDDRCYFSYNAFKTYLYTSVHNLCINSKKHKEVENRYVNYVSVNSEDEDDKEELDRKIMEEEIFRKLHQAVSELPPRCREVFEYILQGKRNDEIALLLNVSPFTVKVQRNIGKRLLRDKLGKYYDWAFFILLESFIS